MFALPYFEIKPIQIVADEPCLPQRWHPLITLASIDWHIRGQD